MIPVRYQKTLALYKVTPTKQPNGSTIDTYVLQGNYIGMTQEINDTISASVYGASIDKMLRITSPTNKLESYLKPKVVSKTDNISKYYIVFESNLYRIVVVRTKWIDIELIGGFDGNDIH